MHNWHIRLNHHQLSDHQRERFDRNKNGRLEANELPGDRFGQLLKSSDANKDGALDKDELKKAFERLRGPGQRPGARPDGAGRRGQDGGDRPKRPGRPKGDKKDSDKRPREKKVDA